jgi:hypothetical protein
MAITVRAGYEISYDCPQPTPMILALSVHPSRRRDLITPDRLLVRPAHLLIYYFIFYSTSKSFSVF